MANSHESRVKILLTSNEGPLSTGVVGADRGAPTLEADGVGVTGLLKRIRRAGLLFGVGSEEDGTSWTATDTFFFEILHSCFDNGFRFGSTRFF